MKLSDQAIGCLMMALQKSLLEQIDIVPMLKEFDFAKMDNNQLLIENPPDIKVKVPIQQASPQVKVREAENTYFGYSSGHDSDA